MPHSPLLRFASLSLSFVLALLLSGCTTPRVTQQAAGARRIIATTAAPAAIGPYSQAVQVGNTLYLSGQIPIDPATGQIVEGDIRVQTRQVLQNLYAVMEAAGFQWSDVVQVQVFLTDLADFPAMNEEYATVFTKDPPARATVQVAALPRGSRVEIMATAVK